MLWVRTGVPGHTTQAALSPSTRGRLGLSGGVGYGTCVWAHPQGVCEARAQTMPSGSTWSQLPSHPLPAGARPWRCVRGPPPSGAWRVRPRVAAGRAVVGPSPPRTWSERAHRRVLRPRGGWRSSAPGGACAPSARSRSRRWAAGSSHPRRCPRRRHGSPLVTPRPLKAELEMGPTGAPIILRVPLSGAAWHAAGNHGDGNHGEGRVKAWRCFTASPSFLPRVPDSITRHVVGPAAPQAVGRGHAPHWPRSPPPPPPLCLADTAGRGGRKYS